MKEKTISYPLSNSEFLKVLSNSFREFIISGTSRSTAKLKPLHGAIAKDIAQRLGDGYQVKAQGYGANNEGTIHGRYIDKKVDITIYHNNKPVAGVAVKFIMQNYAQNSNNYFENMLGETANIRTANYPYFQIFIILDRLPYYDRNKNIKRWETFTEHNFAKYVTLSHDDTDKYLHTPNKTLIYILHIPDYEAVNSKEYMSLYNSIDFEMENSCSNKVDFGNAVILNDYELFRKKVYHTIMAM